MPTRTLRALALFALALSPLSVAQQEAPPTVAAAQARMKAKDYAGAAELSSDEPAPRERRPPEREFDEVPTATT